MPEKRRLPPIRPILSPMPKGKANGRPVTSRHSRRTTRRISAAAAPKRPSKESLAAPTTFRIPSDGQRICAVPRTFPPQRAPIPRHAMHFTGRPPNHGPLRQTQPSRPPRASSCPGSKVDSPVATGPFRRPPKRPPARSPPPNATHHDDPSCLAIGTLGATPADTDIGSHASTCNNAPPRGWMIGNMPGERYSAQQNQ